jgi:hypothetical protein
LGTRDVTRLFGIAAAVRGLAAAALLLRKVHDQSFAFEQPDRIEPGFGDEQIDEASREQIDIA